MCGLKLKYSGERERSVSVHCFCERLCGVEFSLDAVVVVVVGFGVTYIHCAACVGSPPAQVRDHHH